jgi:hypothetical protein
MIWRLGGIRSDDLWVQKGVRYFNLEKWCIECVLTHIRTFFPFGSDFVKWLSEMPLYFYWSSPFDYFSVWALCFLLFHYLQGTADRFVRARTRSHPTLCSALWYDCVETSLILCSVGGAYIAWIYPRHIYIGYIRLYLGNFTTKVLDIVSHQYPLFCFYRYFGPRVRSREKHLLTEIGGYAPAILYGLWKRQDILHYYSIRWLDLVVIIVLSVVCRWVVVRRQNDPVVVVHSHPQ